MRPERVTEEEFDALVATAFEGLPRWVREAVGEVAVMVEDAPEPGLHDGTGMLLGVYHGVPAIRRGERIPGSMPDRIVLYRRPILLATPAPDLLAARIRSVLLHEIGHALGMSEARLREMGVR